MDTENKINTLFKTLSGGNGLNCEHLYRSLSLAVLTYLNRLIR